MDPLALYIHWPFCVSKCPYCDFNSHVRERVNHTIWTQALLQELQTASLTQKRPLSSIFFGGGTPSLMEPQTVYSLIEEAKKLFGFSSHIEITLETNPNSFETQRFLDFKSAGINRVSIGIQSFEQEALKFLGRAHSLAEAYSALESAQKIFERVSFDLIYARPHQTLKQWEAELSHALTFSPTHLSLYQLTFEEGTVFEKKLKKGDIKALSENMSSLLYEKTQEIMNHHFLPAYEVSNHAQKGQESRHNLCYWNYHDYIGIGPGAHGRIREEHNEKKGNYATQNLKLPEKWLAGVQKEGHGLETKLCLEKETMFEEALLMGIRLREGIVLETLKRISETLLNSLLARPSLKILEQEGFLVKTPTHLKATSKGMPILNAILAYII
ncbi:MAG: coproporphyrinogen III oxidase [Proteobacteria bacterium]|nr:coproporphyrinogen III oxidase [Pseudomonadota bacterium]